MAYPDYVPPRAFVLGSGFSAMMGLSTLSGLFAAIMADIRRPEEGDRDVILSSIATLYPHFRPDVSPPHYPPFEEFLGLVEVTTELEFLNPGHWRDIRLRSLRLLTDYIATRGQAGEEHPVLCSFVERLQPGDVVITFNWDNLIERTLYRQEKDFSFVADPRRVTLLKLHGSINWLEPPADTAHVHPELVESLADGIFCTKDYRYHDAWVGLNQPPLILPPTAWKRIGESPFLRSLWSMAVRALVRAEHLSFIGYSIPRDDLQARMLLTTGWGARRIAAAVDGQPALEYTLLDPDPEVCGRYVSLLGSAVQYIQAGLSEDCLPIVFHDTVDDEP